MKLFDFATLRANLLRQAIHFSEALQLLSHHHSSPKRSISTSHKSLANLGYKKMMILQTPIRFFPAIGGVENHVYYLSNELINDGYGVKVICANEPQSLVKEMNSIKIDRLNYSFKITNTNISFSLPFKIL